MVMSLLFEIVCSNVSQGWIAVLCEGTGDWEWQAKFWHVGTATSRNPCWLCSCTQAGPTGWTHLVDKPPRRGDWLLHSRPQNPLVLLPGFSAFMLRFDVMHSLCLGVCQWVNACVLMWCCEQNVFRDGALRSRLWTAWLHFMTWLYARGLESSQRLFTPRRLLVHTGDYLELQGKAWNSRLITNWLASVVCEQQVLPGDATGSLIVSLQWSLNDLFHQSESRGRRFTPAEAANYSNTARQVVRLYRALSYHYWTQRLLRLPMRPKVHALWELAKVVETDLINPRCSHCFASESFLKELLKTAKATSRTTMALSAFRRYMVRLAWRWRGLERTRARRKRPEPSRSLHSD